MTPLHVANSCSGCSRDIKFTNIYRIDRALVSCQGVPDDMKAALQLVVGRANDGDAFWIEKIVEHIW